MAQRVRIEDLRIGSSVLVDTYLEGVREGVVSGITPARPLPSGGDYDRSDFEARVAVDIPGLYPKAVYLDQIVRVLS